MPATQDSQTSLNSYLRSDVSVSSMDGTILRGYRYDLHSPEDGKRNRIPPSKTPLLCIPSELGNTGEYDQLISALANQPGAPRRVLSFDLRGRGRSELGQNKDTTTETDADDIISICDAMGLHHCDVLVTGRAALSVLLVGPKRPSTIGRLILNDGGPEFDSVGIAKLGTTMKRAPAPADWADAVDILKKIKGATFSSFDDTDWKDMAHTVWKDENGRPVQNYNDKLYRLSNADDFDIKQPTVWQEFALFKNTPTLFIRGSKSELMSEALADKILSHQKYAKLAIATGQGHAPALHKDTLPQHIAEFLATTR